MKIVHAKFLSHQVPASGFVFTYMILELICINPVIKLTTQVFTTVFWG